MLGQTRGGGWRRGHEGERNKISLRLRGSEGRGALEVNSRELSRPGWRVLCLILLFGLVLLGAGGRIFRLYFQLIGSGYYLPHTPTQCGECIFCNVRLELCPRYLKVYTNPLRLFVQHYSLKDFCIRILPPWEAFLLTFY